MILEYITIALLCAIVLGTLWSFHCNEKTFKQRMDILFSPNGLEKVKRASFDKHFIYLLFFRDPYKLYK
jgi:hypothetical protein